MTQLSEAVEIQVQNLPQAAQIYYGEQMAHGKEDIFGTIAQLRDSDTIPAQYRVSAGLALAQLTELLNGEPPPRAKSELDALEHVNAEIDAAKEAGDTERANMLQESIRKVAAAALTDEEIAAHELIGAAVVDELADVQMEKYNAAYEKSAELALRSLKRQMADDEAEAFFKQHEEPKIRLALSRAFGI
jgi:hypothetical protein